MTRNQTVANLPDPCHKIRNQEVADMSDRIEKTVDLNAPVERVWQALTDHEQFGEWFKVSLDGPFVVGVLSTGQMTYPGYEHMKWRAVVVAAEPMRYFAFRWSHPGPGEVGDEAQLPSTLVEFTLAPTLAGVRLTIVESGFESIPADRRDSVFRGNEQGWEEQGRNIKAYVES